MKKRSDLRGRKKGSDLRGRKKGSLVAESPQNNDILRPPIEDIITENEILCSILSKLTLREAVSCSILSPRWRHLWTNRSKLNFRASNLFDAHMVNLIFSPNTPLTEEEIVDLVKGNTDYFIQSVNSVLRQHQGSSRLDEFEVRYPLNKSHTPHLDPWVDYAVSSKTKVLGLYLHRPNCTKFDEELYDFPCHLLGSSSSLEDLNLTRCSLKPPGEFNALRHLRKLMLIYVDVTTEGMINLLSNCFALESLNLHMCNQLVSLRIPHPLSQLQNLVVGECNKLREININAINLSNLSYWGVPVDLILGQSSQLIDAHIVFKTEASEPNLDFYLNKLSSSLPHVRLLSLRLSGDFKVPDFPKASNSFSHLVHLDWCWNLVDKMNLLHLATLLDACPLLEELNFRMMTAGCIVEPPQNLKRLKKTIKRHPHSHLKTVRIMDFYYDKWHVLFMLYFLKNATELNLMTIMKGNEEGLVRMGLQRVSDEHISILKQQVPAKVQFSVV